MIFPDGGRNYLRSCTTTSGCASTACCRRPARSSAIADAAARTATATRSCRTSCSRGRPIASAPRSTCSSCTASARCPCRSSPTATRSRRSSGRVSEKGLLDRTYRDPTVVERTVGEVMDRPLPTIDAADAARRRVRAAVRRRAGARRRRARARRRRRHQARPARVPRPPRRPRPLSDATSSDASQRSGRRASSSSR